MQSAKVLTALLLAPLLLGAPARAQQELVSAKSMSLDLALELARAAIGVSGAPLGTNDESCAKAGIAAIRDKLDF
jgi:hypothetical protein